jgi:hypothetical protein
MHLVGKILKPFFSDNLLAARELLYLIIFWFISDVSVSRHVASNDQNR